jgi:AraC-like DNA-binding protein
METLFKHGTDTPDNNKIKPSIMPVKKHHSAYLLAAIINLKEYIDNNPSKFKTSSDLLNHLNTPNRSTLEKVFKAVYGARIKEYQVLQRLNMAKEMMKKGIPKKMIARKCLYQSSSAFSTAFKKHFGISPTEWEHTIPTDDLL